MLFFLLLNFSHNILAQNIIAVDSLSIASTKISIYRDSIKIGVATGFVVKKGEKYFLITNKHVVTGLNPFDGSPVLKDSLIPNALIVSHHHNSLSFWSNFKYPLYDSLNTPVWIEHLSNSLIDVIAIPTRTINEHDYFTIDYDNAESNVHIGPSELVNIIGYPSGISSTGGNGIMGIWKSGHIASEPDFDINGDPYFYIDATTSGGMSGSPVVYKSILYHISKKNEIVMNDKSFSIFLGVYSSQYLKESLGIVWKPKVIKEILENE